MGFLSKFWKILLGVVLIGLGVLSYFYWWPELLTLIKGGLGLVLALIGLIFLVVGFTE